MPPTLTPQPTSVPTLLSSQRYRLLNVEFGTYLVDGPTHTTSDGGITGVWRFEENFGGRVRIVNVANETSLIPGFFGEVRQGRPTPGDLWTLSDQGGGEFFILSAIGTRLDADDGGLIDLSIGAERDERWILIPVAGTD